MAVCWVVTIACSSLKHQQILLHKRLIPDEILQILICWPFLLLRQLVHLTAKLLWGILVESEGLTSWSMWDYCIFLLSWRMWRHSIHIESCQRFFWWSRMWEKRIERIMLLTAFSVTQQQPNQTYITCRGRITLTGRSCQRSLNFGGLDRSQWKHRRLSVWNQPLSWRSSWEHRWRDKQQHTSCGNTLDKVRVHRGCLCTTDRSWGNCQCSV